MIIIHKQALSRIFIFCFILMLLVMFPLSADVVSAGVGGAGVGGAIGGNPFSDVSATDWFYADVQKAHALGLIDGKTAGGFAPGDNLTYAEAIKLAACMHQLHATGSVALEGSGTPWYRVYVDYAVEQRIISEAYDAARNWNDVATRSGYMEIFVNALPESALPDINSVADGAIPDVPMTHPGSAAIYKLYRAGIVIGVDEARNCNPGSNIRRSEVAAILTRMMDPSARQRFEAAGQPGNGLPSGNDTPSGNGAATDNGALPSGNLPSEGVLEGFWHSAPNFSGGIRASFYFLEGGWLCYYTDANGSIYSGEWGIGSTGAMEITGYLQEYDGVNDEYVYEEEGSALTLSAEYIASDPATGNPALVLDGQKYWLMNKPTDVINGSPLYINFDENLTNKGYKNRGAILRENPDRYWDEHIVIYCDIELYDFKVSLINHDYDERNRFYIYIEEDTYNLKTLAPNQYIEYVTHIPEGISIEAISFTDSGGTTYSYILAYNGKDGTTCAYKTDELQRR